MGEGKEMRKGVGEEMLKEMGEQGGVGEEDGEGRK